MGKLAWPHVRALLILFHGAMVVVMSLPHPDAMLGGMGWESANVQAEVQRWVAGLEQVGVHTTPEALSSGVRARAESYRGVHSAVTAPFAAYSQRSGALQGWVMFAKPQRHPAELHLDVSDGRTWRPLYRPHSAEHDFWGEQLRHHRMRKQLGRFARTFDVSTYDRLAEFLARQAALAFPDERLVRVRLYRYATLRPEAVRAGETPVGEYEHERLYRVVALLGDAP